MQPSDSPFPLTRRHTIAGLAAALAAVAAYPARAGAAQASPQERNQPMATQQPPEGDPTSPNKLLTALHYEIDFRASPQRFYEAILDSKQFAACTGMPATIDPTPGGAFALFGGLIEGRNVELVPNPSPRIVQAWRPKSWTPGVYSLIHFEFKPRGDESTLNFDHTSFPVGDHDHLDWGWQNRYWKPLQAYFAKG